MNTSSALTFNQLEVGQEWTSETRTITANDIGDFADLTGDRTPIHVDPAFAATTPFRQCIAHGILGMALGSGLSIEAPSVRMAAFLGIREWRFVGPLFVGDVIHVRKRVIEMKPRGVGRRGEVVWHVEVINQKGDVVQQGITETLVEGDLAAKRVSQANGQLAST